MRFNTSSLRRRSNCRKDIKMEEELAPIKIFYTCAPKDWSHQDELEKHLADLKRQKLITTWSEQSIVPGEARTQVIQTRLNEADIILVFLSPDFLSSDAYESIGLQKALQRQSIKQTEIIPIILRHVAWKKSL